MGITRLTGWTIQGWPISDGTSDGLWSTAAEQQNGSWAGFLYLVKRGEPHCLLVTTAPIYPTEAEAVDAMDDLVTKVKALDLDAPGTFASCEAKEAGG